MKKKVIIFVSGNGSNMENIITSFTTNDSIEVVKVFSNKPNCKALEKAANHNIPTIVFDKEELNNGVILDSIRKENPDLIILAGFLLKIPKNITREFHNRIINIHPSLLPRHGGKGMYGKYVHEAVIRNKDKKSGITIHYVNENYDEGAIIKQYSCVVDSVETVESLSFKIHELEMKYFPLAIKSILL